LRRSLEPGAQGLDGGGEAGLAAAGQAQERLLLVRERSDEQDHVDGPAVLHPHHDLKERRGLRVDADQEAGSESREWSEPQDLQEATHEPEPFPVDALPAEAEAAVVEYQAYGQQPLPMVASSALGAMSLAVQGLVDVQREAALNGPVSLAIVVIADSGERKTACDRTFARAAEDWAREEAKRLAPEIRKAREAREGHEAEKAGILTAIR
jgi:hypothetical protein